MELFSGCSKQESATETTVTQYKTNTVYVTDSKQIELAFVKGYDAGFALCSDIDKGLVANPAAGKERFAAETKAYLSTVSR